ncbi:hypothetical protein [Chitinophaga polysaccharea]|uniref:hypothetical protein n=1 Tax=Chitinophaga polysaccharea TaxID=1293035 RepID=UPI0031EC90C2
MAILAGVSGTSKSFFRWLYHKTRRSHGYIMRWLLFTLLIYASWYIHPLCAVFCFIPYFHTVFQPKVNFLYYLQLYMLNLSWNITVSYWLCEVRIFEGIGTLLINSFLFLLPVTCWHLFVRYGHIKRGKALSLLLWWILFEYLHHIWDFSWTWLTIGNVFGKNPHWVMWYAYLGVLGGSAWILICNYTIYALARGARSVQQIASCLMMLIIPIGISWVILATKDPATKTTTKHVTVVGTSFTGIDTLNDIQKIAKIDTLFSNPPSFNADITILPETIICEDIWSNKFTNTNLYARLKQNLFRWHTQHIIAGALLNMPSPGGIHTEERMGLPLAYNQYNAALLINHSDIINVKQKKIFVPVDEFLPPYLSFLKVKSYRFSSDTDNPDLFKIDNCSYFICICYEAVNSIFVASHLNKEASALLMLSSESFFGYTEVGRQQYMNICKLRCIENNLPLLKSSNDGILFTADNKGNITAMQRVRENCLINSRINLSTLSFYYLLVPFILPGLVVTLAGILMINAFIGVKQKRKNMLIKNSPIAA